MPDPTPTGGRSLAPALAAAGGVLVGAVLTYPAALLAVMSAGMGHGHYRAARALFPIPLLLTHLTGDTVSTPLIALALLQFPIYGGVLGWGLARRKRTVAILPAVHAAAVLATFSGAVPNFG